MDKNKILVEKCKDLTRSVTRSLECPVCFEPPDIPIQCMNGHFVCESCHQTIGNSCPTCKGHYALNGSNRCYAIQGIADQMRSLNLSLETLDKAFGEGPNNLIDKYRDLIRTVLTRVSKLMTETHDTFISLSKDTTENKQIQVDNDKRIKIVAQHMNEFVCFIKDIEKDLTCLRMQL